MKQINKKSSLLLLSLFACTIGYSQMPYLDTAWVRESPIVGTGLYYHTSTIVFSGKLYSTSRVLNVNGDTDVITTKYNANGTIAWSSTFSGNFSGGGNDYGIELKALGSYVWVTGAVKNNTTGYDWCLLKYSTSTGSLVASYSFNGTGNGDDVPSDLLVESSAVYVCGGSEATNGFSDYAVKKWVSSGPGSGWTVYYDYASLHDGATKIVSSGTTVTVTGGSMSAINDWDVASLSIHKLAGSVSSSRTNTSATMVEANGMVTDSLNNIYVTGYATIGGDKEIQTIKLDSSLNFLWQTGFDQSADDVGKDVAVDGSGNVYVTGYTGVAGGKTKSVLIKYASNGDTLFTQYFGNVDEGLGAKGQKLTIDSNNDILITGTTADHDSIQQMFFSQYNSTGALQFVSEFTSYGIDEEALDIDVDADSVYITGLSSAMSGPVQTVIKYVRLQNPDPTYFYLGGEKSYWSQQPGMYSFGTTDSTHLTGYVDSTLVVDVRYYPIEGIHYVFFSPEANQTEVDSIINLIETEPNFDKEYLVATLTRHNDLPHTEEKYAGTSNHIEVIFDDHNIDIIDVENFADEYEMELIFAPDASIENGVYVFRINDRTDGYFNPNATFEIAATIWENDADTVERVNPSMRMFRPHDPNDPLYTQLWWAEDGSVTCNGKFSDGNDIGLDCAWNFEQENEPTEPYYSGENIVVAVIDFHGVEYSHPDASGMFIDGWQSPAGLGVIVPIFMDTYFSSDNYKAHLQNVSGIIGARGDNSEGTIGVAHGAHIIPCLQFGSSDQLSTILQQLIVETGPRQVDIINMSLGWGGVTKEEGELFSFYLPLVNCYANGRFDEAGIEDPRGIVLVASSGFVNSGSAYKLNIPAAFNQVLSVGGTNPDDGVKALGDGFDPSSPDSPWGSAYHESLDVAAPGICITSTDFTDNNPEFPTYGGSGYTTGNYYSFSGTSASAPIVAGIAALVMQKDSMLTQEQVYDAIRFSAEKVGGYSYSNNWETGRCMELGYGRVNACAALNILPYLSTETAETVSFVTVYPNPSNNELTVSLEGIGNYSMTIVDISGKIVFTASYTQSQVQLDITPFSDGLYYLSIVDLDTDKVYNSKIVKH